MIKTIYEYYCDLCGKKYGEKDLQDIWIPTVSFHDHTDGRSYYKENELKYKNDKVQICRNCLKRVTVVHDDGVQCQDLKFIERGK